MRGRLLVAACCAASALAALPAFGAAALAAVPAAAAKGCADLPPHSAIPVVDAADVLPPQPEAFLAADLMTYHLTGHEAIVAATVRNLGGDDVASFAKRLFDCWGVGDKGSDNGVLILVAMVERRTRIELGAGLTERVPDEQLNLALETMTAPLRSGDVAGGLRAAAVALAGDLGTPLPDTAAVAAGATTSPGGGEVDVPDGVAGFPDLQRMPGVDTFGGSDDTGSGLAWLVPLMFVGGILLTLVRFVIGAGRVGGSSAWGAPTIFRNGNWQHSSDDSWRGGAGSHWGSNWSGGSGDSGDSGGSSGGGGGSSFGGGSSGGGGASGSW